MSESSILCVDCQTVELHTAALVSAYRLAEGDLRRICYKRVCQACGKTQLFEKDISDQVMFSSVMEAKQERVENSSPEKSKRWNFLATAQNWF